VALEKQMFGVERGIALTPALSHSMEEGEGEGQRLTSSTGSLIRDFQKAFMRPTQKVFAALFAALFLAPAVHAQPVGIMVASYFVPGPKWDAMNYAASRVPLIAIMNPNSGPGASQSASYVNALLKTHQAGGKVIGYVSSDYANRPIADVKADIDRYVLWYLVDGFFIDEMENDSVQAHLDFYAEIYQYIKSKGAQYTVCGNPGSNTQES
jgi:hypothetical protein